MAAVLLDPTPVPQVADGMIVRVIYIGQQKLRYRWQDDKGRSVVPEWWDGTDWMDTPQITTDAYEDSRRQPRVTYDGIPYRLETGRECFMPIEAARMWFGDERAANVMETGLNRKGIRAWVNDRATEVRRLRCLYDNRMGDETTIIGHPIVEVFTIDGERIPMVLDDPLGLNSTPASMSEAEQSDLYRLIAKQQAQLDQLKRQMEAQKAGPKSVSPRPKPREDGEDQDADQRVVALSDLPEDPGG